MIHALPLALVLALQGATALQAPAHADLHPAETDFYLEFGDFSTVLPALDAAPILRFIRDERVKAVLAQLGPVPDSSLAQLVAQGLAKASPESKPETWLPGLKTVSLSVVAIGPPSAEAAPVALLAVADFATAEQAQALHGVLVAHAPKHEPLAGPLAGAELLTMGEKPEDQLWVAAAGTRLVVGGKPSKVEDYVARADKKSTGLGQSDSFLKPFAALEKSSGKPVLWFALNRPLKDILAKVQASGEDAGAAAFLDQIPSDLNPLGSPRVARMQLVGDRFVTEMISLETGAVSASKPVDPAWLEPAPSSAMLVYATAFDGAAAGKRLRALLAKDEQSAATLAALEEKLGFGPERVLARLGPGMTVYSAPPAGLGWPDVRVWIDCEDPAAFTADFEALVNSLGETLPGFLAKTKPYKVKKTGSEEKIEVPITTLTLPPGLVELPMLSLAPSFAPVGKKLVFGVGSMDVKNELKRVHSGEGEAIVAGKNPLTALGFTLPAEARSVVVMDWAKLFGSILDMLKAFGPMMGDQLPIDLAKLPPGSIFGEYFKPTFHYAKPVAGGLYRRNEASFGPETWIGLLGAAVVANNMQRAMQGTMPVTPPPDQPSGGR